MTGELTIFIGPAEALPAKAVAATATHIAVITLDLICLYIAISSFAFQTGRTWLSSAHSS
jgi:hypothetical protein